jgi:V8-like Glu-specific endopeptidase
MKGMHRWVGALKWKTGLGYDAFGSGVLISKNLVLTAAHNIFDHD